MRSIAQVSFAATAPQRSSRSRAFTRRFGYLAMGGQIVDATIVAAPKQRNTKEEKDEIKAGKVPEDWKRIASQAAPEGPRRALDRQVLQGQGRRGRKAQRDIAIPAFGYKNQG
jgi:transposase, IS5 family